MREVKRWQLRGMEPRAPVLSHRCSDHWAATTSQESLCTSNSSHDCQPFTFNQPFNRFLFCITTTNLQYKKRGIIRLFFALFYSQTQHTRRIFEDLIAKQTQEALRDSPIVRRQRRNSNKKAYLQKEKPHSKPDSVFQKLIDRFDPMRLTSGAKTRVKSWCTCRARVSQRYCFYHCIIALGVACFYACADWIILWTICDVIPGAGCGRNKTAPVVRSWTHPIRGGAVKSSLWVLVPFLACAVCTNLVDVGFEGIWKARSSRVSLFVLWAEAVPVRLETTTTPNWGCLFGVPSSNKALPGEVRPFCWLTNTSLKSKKRYLMLWFSFWSQLARVLNIFSSGC